MRTKKQAFCRQHLLGPSHSTLLPLKLIFLYLQAPSLELLVLQGILNESWRNSCSFKTRFIQVVLTLNFWIISPLPSWSSKLTTLWPLSCGHSWVRTSTNKSIFAYIPKGKHPSSEVLYFADRLLCLLIFEDTQWQFDYWTCPNIKVHVHFNSCTSRLHGMTGRVPKFSWALYIHW